MIPARWDASQDTFEWAILDNQAKVLRRGKDYLNALPQCDETEVIVPASMVGFISAQLPPGSRTKILNALPFLVEAGLISAPEDTHAVLASQFESRIVVAVIQKAWMKSALERLTRKEIFPIRMFPETLLPILPNDGWAMVSRGHESFIRMNNSQGIPLNVDAGAEVPPPVLELALMQFDKTRRPVNIDIYGEHPTNAADWAAQLGVLLSRPIEQEWFVSSTKPIVNLLQGEFQPSGAISRNLIAFKPAAITLAVLILMQVSFMIIDYAGKARKNSMLDRAMITQFKASFPNATAIVDAPLQMKRNLDDLKHGAGQISNADFLPLLAAITSNIGPVSAERLKSMVYQNGKLELNLTMPDMEQAQAMRQRLISAGLSATIESTKPSPMGLEMQISISGGAI
jgi:general secretion pathway protein L